MSRCSNRAHILAPAIVYMQNTVLMYGLIEGYITQYQKTICFTEDLSSQNINCFFFIFKEMCFGLTFHNKLEAMK